MKRLIYPASRAVEHAVNLPGVVPLRFFPVLWPLWQVETSADVYDQQQFEVIDHFIVRAVEEGGIHDRDELVAFLRLPGGLVDRCLAFLRLIGHVTGPGTGIALTELGRTSVADGIRYVAKNSRQTILIERQTGWPLPRAYYDANVQVLDTPEIDEGRLSDRTRFLPVFTLAELSPQLLAWLEEIPDRARYNLPSQLRNLRQTAAPRDGYLPSYLIETVDGRVLAYSNVGEQRDDFLERVCAKTSVNHLIQARGLRDPEEVWRAWLAKSSDYGSGRLRQGPNGQWQVVLAAGAFGEPPKPSVRRIGTYQFHANYFLQIWCDDRATREAALWQRCLGIATLPEVTSEAELLRRMRGLAGSLQVPETTMAQLRRHAEGVGDMRLDRLTA